MNEIFASSSYKKYNEYEKLIKRHPIKYLEYMFGVKLKWYQKIHLLSVFWRLELKEELKKREFNRLMGKYINKK